jgi:hypothetical protein
MSLLKTFFGNSSKDDIDDVELFRLHLLNHLKRITDLGEPYTSFVRNFFSNDIIPTLVYATSEKMALSQSDKKEHGFGILNAPICYQISTLPLSIRNAKKWFIQTYGGYSKLLERSWNSDYFRGPNCEVLIHIIYGRIKNSAWVNMTIFPINSSSFSFKPILSIELLMESEKPK